MNYDGPPRKPEAKVKLVQPKGCCGEVEWYSCSALPSIYLCSLALPMS